MILILLLYADSNFTASGSFNLYMTLPNQLELYNSLIFNLVFGEKNETPDLILCFLINNVPS